MKEYLSFYEGHFLPVYADLVAYISDKPIQILTEIENSYSHLMQYLNSDNSGEIRKENLKKAHSHLVRVTLDCSKLLWAEMNSEISALIRDSDKRRYMLNITDEKFFANFEKFKEGARKARKAEISQIGMGAHEEVAKLYKETIASGYNILNGIDTSKRNDYKKFKVKSLLREQGMSFIVGILASSVVWWLTT